VKIFNREHQLTSEKKLIQTPTHLPKLPRKWKEKSSCIYLLTINYYRNRSPKTQNSNIKFQFLHDTLGQKHKLQNPNIKTRRL
jgi:hypothetical protein